MAFGFLTNKEAKERIASLSQAISAKGGTPKQYPDFQTNKEAKANIAEFAAQLAGMSPAENHADPDGQFPPDLQHRLEALQANSDRIAAKLAKSKEDAAKLTAKAEALKAANAAIATKPTPANHTTPSRPTMSPTKFATASLEATMKTALNGLASAPDREQAVAELTQRGLTASKESVTIDRDTFGMLSAESRTAFCRAGGKIVDAKQANKPDFSHLHGIERTRAAMQWQRQQEETTATRRSADAELTFPSETRNPRSAQQFMALSEIAIGRVIQECEDERNGRTLRQELFDARENLTLNWKQGDTLGRSEFTMRFGRAFGAINKYGPECPTWEDPAPPVSPNAMTAGQWIGLTETKIAGMTSQLTSKQWGRNQRAELKRAYRDGSPAEKSALKTMFAGLALSPLTAYPSELI